MNCKEKNNELKLNLVHVKEKCLSIIKHLVSNLIKVKHDTSIKSNRLFEIN